MIPYLYGLLNYATFYEARSASPSFRPTFRFFDHRLSLLGFLGCLGAMLAIDLPAGVIGISVLFAIFQYLKRTVGPARWADSQRSYHLQHVREHLLAAAAEPEHPRDWRPQVLAITGDSKRQIPLLRFASWIQGGSGSTTAVRIIEGKGLKMVKIRQAEEETLRAEILKHNLDAFPLVVSAPSFQTGVETLIQSFGIGPVKANILMVNWFQNDVKGIFGPHEFISGPYLKMAFRLGSNVILLDTKESRYEELAADKTRARYIDIWWADDKTGHLMLLLAYLMKRDDLWEGSSIRVLAMGHDKTLGVLQKNLEEARIEAEPTIVPDLNPDSIIAHSRETSLVFLPFSLASNHIRGPFGFKLETLLPELPITALVMAAEDIDLDAEPEEGKAGEMAGVADAAQAARDKAQEAEKEASKTLAAAQKAEKRLNDMISSAKPGIDRKEMEEIERAVAEADSATVAAEKASRKVAKARAKAKDAVREAEARGAKKPLDVNGDKGSDSAEAET